MTRAALAAALCALPAFAAPLSAKLVLYHFNLQYVAGGMRGFPDGKSKDPDFDLSESEVEDLIVTQSFEPILDVLQRHSSWHIDLELQGLMIEVMAARHPAVLAKLRTLAKAGQVEVVSFHYSDQLFLAYPKRDLVRSVKRNRKVFEQNDVPLSGVVFNQEGQFNEGMLKVMAENGFSTAVMPSNLWSYQHDTQPPARFLQRYGVDVVMSGGGAFGDLSMDWDGPGDGELIVTGQTNPYLGRKVFHTIPAEVTKWENDRAAEESSGMKLMTVGEVVAEAKARGAFPEMPALTDGTWRPGNTHNLLRWMGGLGGLFDLLLVTENDDAVLTRNVAASIDVAACEAVVAKFGTGAAALDEAARELMLAQVSDSTGWNPWLGEVRYSLDHAAAASAAARRCIDAPELRGPKKRRVALASGAVTDDAAPLGPLAGAATDAPFTVITDAPGRTVTLSWKRLTPERLELVVDATAGTDRLLSIVLPMGSDHIVYAPATDEDGLVDLAPAEFSASVEHTIPAPSGLAGLGPNRFLLKDTRVEHLAFLVRPGARELEVRDETLHAEEPAHWRFEIVDADAARANAFAHALNVTPVVEYELTPRGGCGCGSGGAPLALLGLVALRRRRPR